MTDESRPRKPAAADGEPFCNSRAENTGKADTFTDEHRAFKAGLDAGYQAMASDTEREEEARAWCSALSGETLRVGVA